ncbi:hypothetical protein Swol_2011 [Syntrophomonas wolfei subsp. wolfei str. Goettingen G311]|jgi:hypothetical protein|uniref:Uncharacterized protein n=2 Tax=Syntrophomonas wolfei TaxID=863 RepID=Q0AVE8_SYNWW|nr:hypothetical protein Swol_2011 [Syntrophomonas wolfei subsp. wolfei str. Goettingen G311]
MGITAAAPIFPAREGDNTFAQLRYSPGEIAQLVLYADEQIGCHGYGKAHIGDKVQHTFHFSHILSRHNNINKDAKTSGTCPPASCHRLSGQLQTIQQQMDRVVDAIKKGLPFEHMSSYFSELGEQKKYLESQLANYRSPFAEITRQDVLNYMKKQQGRLVFNTSAETRKEIMTSYVKEAKVLGKNIDILLKLQLKSSHNAGVGGGT